MYQRIFYLNKFVAQLFKLMAKQHILVSVSANAFVEFYFAENIFRNQKVESGKVVFRAFGCSAGFALPAIFEPEAVVRVVFVGVVSCTANYDAFFVAKSEIFLDEVLVAYSRVTIHKKQVFEPGFARQ